MAVFAINPATLIYAILISLCSEFLSCNLAFVLQSVCCDIFFVWRLSCSLVVLSTLIGVFSGYIGSVSFLNAVLEVVHKLRSVNPKLTYGE